IGCYYSSNWSGNLQGFTWKQNSAINDCARSAYFEDFVAAEVFGPLTSYLKLLDTVVFGDKLLPHNCKLRFPAYKASAYLGPDGESSFEHALLHSSANRIAAMSYSLDVTGPLNQCQSEERLI